MKYVTIINGQQYDVDIETDGRVRINGQEREIDFLHLDGSLYNILADTSSLEVVIDDDGNNRYQLLIDGRIYESQVLDERAMLMANRRGALSIDTGEVMSPMPGLIVSIPVNVGQKVAKGDTVVILESMKMQNELKAARDGIVESIHAKVSQNVDKDDVLIMIGDEEK